MTRSLDGIQSAREWNRPGLSRRCRAIARALIEALLCDGSAGAPSPPDADWIERVVESYDLSIGACTGGLRAGVAALLWLIELLPLVVGARCRMSRLPLPARVAYLEALEAHRSSRLALVLVACKVPMLMGAFEEGRPLSLTGYDRPTTFARRKRFGTST